MVRAGGLDRHNGILGQGIHRLAILCGSYGDVSVVAGNHPAEGTLHVIDGIAIGHPDVQGGQNIAELGILGEGGTTYQLHAGQVHTRCHHDRIRGSFGDAVLGIGNRDGLLTGLAHIVAGDGKILRCQQRSGAVAVKGRDHRHYERIAGGIHMLFRIRGNGLQGLGAGAVAGSGKLTGNFHVMGITGILVFAVGIVILEDYFVPIDLHRGHNALTGRILAIGIDITGVHVGKVGRDRRAALDGHGLVAILRHIVSRPVHIVFVGVIVGPEHHHIHLFRSGGNGLIPIIGIGIIIPSGMEGYMAHDKQDLGFVHAFHRVFECRNGSRNRGFSCVGFCTHHIVADMIDIIVITRILQPRCFRNIAFRIMVTPSVADLGTLAQGSLGSASHIRLGTGNVRIGIAHETDGIVGDAIFADGRQNRFHRRRTAACQICFVLMDVTAENGCRQKCIIRKDGYWQYAQHHDEGDQAADDSLSQIHSLHINSLLFSGASRIFRNRARSGAVLHLNDRCPLPCESLCFFAAGYNLAQ